MNRDEFETITESTPEHDDLERVNCPRAGEIGHRMCGVCSKCGCPLFIPCGHEREAT